MNKLLLLVSFVFMLASCGNISSGDSTKVNNVDELKTALSAAKAGSEIVLANGVWTDVQINFTGIGTEVQPITLRAETEGEVFIEGQSYIRVAGEYLVISGLHFQNGYSPKSAIIEFKVNNDSIANHCIVTSCVFDGFAKPSREMKDHWIRFWGRHNELDRCYIAGKFNDGPTVKVFLTGNEHTKTYHKIQNNHFGPRPRKGGPRGETIQIGSSFTSMTPSHVIIQNNYFEKCDGEVEIISNKSNNCEIRNNIFQECEGSVVFRHGNYGVVDGNYFIGSNDAPYCGGIRIINTGHWVTNNYFFNIIGDEFRSAIAIMNGIHKSPLNRYNQVTDVVVAHNSFVNCKAPWQFSVGNNAGKSDVLPKSEIRSARPLRCLVANNVVYNEEAGNDLIKAYDKVDGVKFKGNVVSNQNALPEGTKGIKEMELTMELKESGIYVPASDQAEKLDNVYPGFAFDEILTDILGTSRATNNLIGAFNLPVVSKPSIDKSAYGPSWFSNEVEATIPEVIAVVAGENIAEKLAAAKSGDVIELSGEFTISESLVIDKKITVTSKEGEKAQVTYTGTEGPAFELTKNANLIVDNVVLIGNNKAIAIAPLEVNMHGNYQISINNADISNFETVVFGYKRSMADTVAFIGTKVSNCANGIVLAAEDDARGDYNCEVVILKDSEFNNVKSNVLNFYRGGYDESTIGGVLSINGCKFTKSGSNDKSKVLLNTTGIVNLNISNNTFENNKVKYIAVLWGEKNDVPVNNTIKNSGVIHTELYLKQKLMY